MKLSKVFKKDVEKYLGIIPDKRRKDFKQFIAENGGYTNAIETLKSQLSKRTEFKVKKEIRQKQVKTQKEYVERKKDIRPKTDVKKRGRKSKKLIESAEKIQKLFRRKKESNKLFTLTPNKTWKTKFSYTLINKLPSGKLYLIGDYHPSPLYLEDFIQVFQFYKVDKYLISKIQELGKGYKVNIGFHIGTAKRTNNYKMELGRVHQKFNYEYSAFYKLVKSTMIFDKFDVYKYLEDVYNEYKKVFEANYDLLINTTIEKIYIDIYKTKPLNGSSYIPLPEWVANKKQ